MKKPFLTAAMGAVMFLLGSPMIIGHACSAGSRAFELWMTGFFVTLTFYLIYRLPTPKKRMSWAIASLFISFFLVNGAYTTWVHSSLSPWPAKPFPAITGPLPRQNPRPDHALLPDSAE